MSFEEKINIKIICIQVSLQSIELKSHRAISVVIVLQLDLQLPVQSVQITIKVVSSNPTHGEVYSIQLYVIKFVSEIL
jgi:hypothetical protein